MMFENVVEILQDSGFEVSDWDGTLDSLILETDASVSDVAFALSESNYSGNVRKDGNKIIVSNIEEI